MSEVQDEPSGQINKPLSLQNFVVGDSLHQNSLSVFRGSDVKLCNISIAHLSPSSHDDPFYLRRGLELVEVLELLVEVLRRGLELVELVEVDH